MKKKFLALICLMITVVMCFSSCGIITRITSLFDKDGKNNGANEGDPDCVHLWSNGYVDTECETSKDAVLKAECCLCGKQNFTDIRTTITDEEFANMFNNEYLLPNFTIMYVEKSVHEDEIWYELADGNAVHSYSYQASTNEFIYYCESDGSSDEGDTANTYYPEALGYTINEYFFEEYPFELFKYDDNQKCYVYTTNTAFDPTTGTLIEVDAVTTIKLYFRDGHFLALDLTTEEDGYEPEQFVGMVIDIGNTSTANGETFANEILEIVNSNSYDSATFYCTSATSEITANDITNILTTLVTSESFYRCYEEIGYQTYYYFDNYSSTTSVSFLNNQNCYLRSVVVQDGKITSISLGVMYGSSYTIEVNY